MKNNQTKISVIVPVYNMEKYLERCVNSILRQTYSNLEVILVDDGSIDCSSELCDQFAESDLRIKVIHKTNGGLSDARNAGLEIATGDFIGYVDSDDWVEPAMYEILLQECLNQEAQIAVCRYREINLENGEENYVEQQKLDKNRWRRPEVLTSQQVLDIYISDPDDYCIYNSVWSKLFRKELVKGMVFPKGHNSEDIVYTTKAFCRAQRCVYVDEPLYNYVVSRPGSIMNDSRSGERMVRDEIPFWREHIREIAETGYGELSEKAAFFFYRRMLAYYERYSGNKNNENCATYLQRLLQTARIEIKRLLQKEYATRGDRLRFRIFLVSPTGYQWFQKIYKRISYREGGK